MIAVQPGRHHGSDEKLAAIGVFTNICHADEQWCGVFHLKGLIFKIFPVDTDRSIAVVLFNIASCNN